MFFFSPHLRLQPSPPSFASLIQPCPTSTTLYITDHTPSQHIPNTMFILSSSAQQHHNQPSNAPKTAPNCTIISPKLHHNQPPTASFCKLTVPQVRGGGSSCHLSTSEAQLVRFHNFRCRTSSCHLSTSEAQLVMETYRITTGLQSACNCITILHPSASNCITLCTNLHYILSPTT